MEFVLSTLIWMVIVVGVIGWLWITVMAFSDGEMLWGIGCLIISPLCLVYGFLNFQELKIPLVLAGIGFVGRIGLGVVSVMV